MVTSDLPPLPSISGLPPLPVMGQVHRRPPPGGARREWQSAKVVEIWEESVNAKTFRFQLHPDTPRHVPGQHYDVRLTAPDGSQAQRSYSVGSGPSAGGTVELSVERIADGDVSPYLHDVIRAGDDVELRGPFGGWFIWRGDTPVLLVGGGSGVVPLMSMLRHWRAIDRPVPLELLVSARSPEDLFYAGDYGDESTVIYTRKIPPGWGRSPARLEAMDLQPLVERALLNDRTVAYVCGSSGFAEHASQLLVALGIDRAAVRVERFGPA